MTAGRDVAASIAVVSVLVTAGCSSSEPVPAEPSESFSTSATSSPTSASTDPVDEAEAAALALVPEYLRTIDDLYLDASLPLDGIYAVAVAPEATAEATAIGTFRSQGYQQTGRSQLESTTVGRVDLTNEPTASPTPLLPTVEVSACVDVSQVQANDPSGVSVVPPERPTYLIQQLTLVNTAYPDASGWRVSSAPNTQAQTCDG